jgi:hypothetical protein
MYEIDMIEESLTNVKRVYQLIKLDHDFFGDAGDMRQLLIFNDVTEMRV